MARKLLRKISIEDGATEAQSFCFAECCINILQQGCTYPKGVEKRIMRLLENREEDVCADIVSRMKAPRSGMMKARKLGPPPPGYKVLHDKDGFPYFVREEKSQHADNKRRWSSPPRDRNDRKRTLYYEDKNPHAYNQYRPRSPTDRHNGTQRPNKRRRRDHYRPNRNQMGRMGSKR